jgi:hypothetical protein
MTIKIESKQQEQITLENLGNEGYRWVDDVYPIDFKLSLSDHFRGFPYELKIINDTIRWYYDNKVEYIKTDNSKVNENLLKENELLKVQLSNIEEWLRTSVTGNESSEHILNLFFND